jgi:hypothetical protein
MEVKTSPKAFFVLESAPTSEDEFSSIYIGTDSPVPRSEPRLPVFNTVRAEFNKKEARLTDQPVESRPKHSRFTEDNPTELMELLESPRNSVPEEDSSRLLRVRGKQSTKKQKLSQQAKAFKHPLTNIETLKLELDSLETSFSLGTIEKMITCRLCGGYMRHPQCMLECTHTCISYVSLQGLHLHLDDRDREHKQVSRVWAEYKCVNVRRR